MDIVWPEGTSDIIENIIDAIGRNVVFFSVASVSGCSECGLNTITDESLDPFCNTCDGIYWIPTYSSGILKSHITWKDSDKMAWETGGQYFEGDCKIKFIYSAENYSIASNASYLIVDDKTMTINRITLLGVPSINRILVHAEEKEKTSS